MLKTFIWIHFLLVPAELLFSVVSWKYQRYSSHVSIHPEDITLYFLLPAQVQGYAQNSKDGEKILLTCIARGQGAIDVEIKCNGETVTEEKGLMRSDTETNKDGTLEIRAHVEISKDDKSKYSYEVIYKNQNIKGNFGKKVFCVFRPVVA